MRKSIIIACFLGALTFAEVQGIQNWEQPAAPVKETPQETSLKAAKKAGVDVREIEDFTSAIKMDQKKEMKEASAAEKEAA